MKYTISMLYKICGGMFAYGFARGMRSEYHNNVYSTRILYSFCNGVYYGTCIIHPMFRLMNRVQYHYQGLDPNHVTVQTHYQDLHTKIYVEPYKEFYGMNYNVIL
jgi:hypothetical protein